MLHYKPVFGIFSKEKDKCRRGRNVYNKPNDVTGRTIRGNIKY